MTKTEGVLNPCATCKFADWKKTANGRRHPDGSGRCTYEFPDTALPMWFIEYSFGRDRARLSTLKEFMAQRHGNRYIYFRNVHRTEPDTCGTYVGAATD